MAGWRDWVSIAMDPSSRPYVRRIVLLHLVLLAAVIALVSLASYEVYDRARAQIVEQAKSRQELLAKQTASAIDSYYTSIAADLNLLRRSEETPGRTDRQGGGGPTGGDNRPPPPRMLRPLWNQLEGRVSHILYVHRETLQIVHAFPEETNKEEARVALQPFGSWLRDLDKPGVSPFRPTRDGGANLIAVPLSADYVLAAVVPVSNVEEQFFRVVNRDHSTFATLLDETGVVMVTSDIGNPAFVPATLPSERATTHPARRVLVRLNMAEVKAGTTEYRDETPASAAFVNAPRERHGPAAPPIPPRLTTVEPVQVDARTFYVVVNSRLAEITAAASTMFTRAFVGAIFVILSVTAILMSTAVRLIRSQRNLERMRHEMLTKELDQARAIQLHWLPNQSACPPHLRVAAVNQTANHISGDFFDWFTLPDGRGVVTIGDVTGHGMSAAFLMATTQLLVRTTLPRVSDPAACLEEVNRQLCAQSFHGQFVTMLVLVIDPGTSTLSLATAGHMPPLRSTGQGFAPMALEPELPLGIAADTTYATARIALDGGATLLLYTDGIQDAAAPDGARFGLPRLLSAVRSGAGMLPQGIIDQVVSEVTAFRGGGPLSDDLTLVALTFTPASVTVPGRPKTMAAGTP